MKANYEPRIDIPGLHRRLSKGEEEVARACLKYADDMMKTDAQQMCLVVMSAFLLAMNRRYGWKAALRPIWEDAVKIRAELKHFYRDGSAPDGAGYSEQRTGHNVEDTASRILLREIGVDLDAWEEGVQYDPKTGEITFK